ncbi:MAG: YrdB family protein [Paracoccaceae bacterium]
MIGMNHALAFLVEVAALIAVGRAGFRVAGGGTAGWIAASLAVLSVGALWYRFAAPNAPGRLEMPGLLILKAGVFGLATAAWWYASSPGLAVGFAVAAAAQLAVALAIGEL